MKVFNRIILALAMAVVMVLGMAGPSMASNDWSQVGNSAGPSEINCLLNTGSGSSSVLYAGTNEGVFSWNGSTWSQIDPADLTGWIYSLTMDGGALCAGTNNGLYELIGGAWRQVDPSLSGNTIFALTTVNEVVYAGVNDVVYSWDGMHSSSVGGTLDGATLTSSTFMDVTSLALDSNGILYAAAGQENDLYELNAGSTAWTLGSPYHVNSLITVDGAVYAGTENDGEHVLSNGSVSSVGGLGGSASLAIGVDGAVYAIAAGGTLYSWNGSNWDQVGEGATGSYDPICLAMSNGAWYTGTDGAGMFKMISGSWADVQSAGSLPVNAVVSSLIMDGSTPYAGTSSGGGTTSSVWSCSGNSWAPVGSLAESTNCLTMNGSTLYAGTEQGVYVLNGISWDAVDNDDLPGDVTSLITVSGVVYAGSDVGSVYELDSGGAWNQLGGTITSGGAILSLTMDGSTLYAGTMHGVFVLNGISWDAVDSADLSDYIPSLITVDGVVYAGDGNVYALGSTGDWARLTTGLPLSGLDSILVANGTLYAGVAYFGSVDYWNGATWSEVGSLLEQDQVSSLIANSNNLYAGTYYNGVWVYQLSASPPAASYAVTYDGNGATSGNVPTVTLSPYNSGATVTVLGNTGGLARTGYNFGGWNTAADGSGTTYQQGATFAITANTTLYAVWTAITTNNGGGGGSPAILTPTVQTDPATSIAATSAVLNGDITSDNGYAVTDYGFLWGTSASSLANTLDVGTNNQSGAFTDTLGSLTAGTTYYFEAYATNSAGTADGAVLSFTAGTQTTTTTPTTPTTTQVFPDVPPSYWASGAIDNLSTQGYVYGYPDGTFKPGNQITRAEFAAIMDKVLKLAPYTPQTPTFTDVNPGDWFYQAVETANHAGIEIGYHDGTFHPNAPISRQEIACVLVQALGKSQLADANAQAVTKFLDNQSIAWWSRGFIYVALQQGLVNGYPDNTYEPRNETIRAEACAMVENFLSTQK